MIYNKYLKNSPCLIFCTIYHNFHNNQTKKCYFCHIHHYSQGNWGPVMWTGTENQNQIQAMTSKSMVLQNYDYVTRGVNLEK